MASTTRQLARRASLVLANFRTRRLIVFAESPSPIGCLCLRRRFSRRTIVSFVASAYARNTRSSAFGARTCTSPGTTTRVTRVTARESSLGSATRRALASKTLNVSLSSRRGFVAYARFTACVPSIIVAKTSARTSAGAGRRNLRDMARRGVSRRRRIGADSTTSRHTSTRHVAKISSSRARARPGARLSDNDRRHARRETGVRDETASGGQRNVQRFRRERAASRAPE
mmetsp:Transcript_4071/g.15696  ORF Transcript_4071/g.15696 Transcript_4071/m.15696 type:complete len:229 (+) Transcript_4071:1280-1966(+)